VDSSQRSGGDGWSEVEQRFFETAPPDVPLQPAAPHSFDDLEAPLPERRRPRRAKQAQQKAKQGNKRQPAEPRERWSPARREAARKLLAALALGRQLAAAVVAAALPLLRRLAAATMDAARDWRARIPGREAARELAVRAFRSVFAPVIEQLPAGRADRGPILAAVAAIVAALGLAAGVVGAYVPHLTFIR
jgi:hypothetical protein